MNHFVHHVITKTEVAIIKQSMKKNKLCTKPNKIL